MSSVISAYATIIAFVLITLIPLWIPVGVTVAPAIAKRIRRIRGTAPVAGSAQTPELVGSVSGRERE